MTAKSGKRWGLEVLYEYKGYVEPDDVVVDIIAVHGLGANPDFAWFRKLDDTARHSTVGVNWLKELLPDTLKANSPRILARVLCFNYDSGWFGKKLTRTRLSDLARKLLDSLGHEVVQPPDQQERPLIFIGHSFGGIVIEQAIVQAGSAGSIHGAHILDVLAGVIFMGTPHAGSDMAKFGFTVAHAAAVLNLGQATLLEDVEVDSWRMRETIDTFIQIVHGKGLKNDDEIVCFFENRPSDYSTRVPFIGRFSSTMLSGMVVDRDSAVLVGCHGVQLDSDHFKLNKFRDGTDSNYRTVTNNIKRIAAKRRLLIQQREEYNRAMQTQHFYVPRKRVKDFVGRGPQLRSIVKNFAAPRSSGLRVLIIQALAGQGKSQLALEFSRISRAQNVYRGIFWVSAADRPLAVNSFRRIAMELDLVSADQAIEDDVVIGLVKRGLEDWHERWLLVFDNYDSPSQFDDIQDFFPDVTSGDILITSRSRGLDRLGEVMKLGPLTDDEGVRLLLRPYNNKDREDYIEQGKRLVRRLGGLALAIEQASSYLAERHMAISQLGSFVQQYEEQRRRILDFVPDKFWEYQKDQSRGYRDKGRALSAFATWEMSFDELFRGDTENAKRAAHLLTLSAFMAPTTISESMFRWYWLTRHFWIREYGADPRRAAWLQSERLRKQNVRITGSVNEVDTWDADDFARIIRACEDLSLVQDVSEDGDSGIRFSLHPLVRDWLQIRQDAEMSSVLVKEVTSVVAGCLGSAWFDGGTLDQRTIVIQHAHECLLRDARLKSAQMMTREGPDLFKAIDLLGRKLYTESRHGAAQDLLRTALLALVMSGNAMVKLMAHGKEQSAHSAWQKLHVDLRISLAHMYLTMRNHSQAETIIREAAGLCSERSLEDEQWRHCSRVLGDVLRLQGQHANALQLQQNLLEWHLSVASPDYPQVYRAKLDVADTLLEMHEWDKALAIYRELGILETEQGLTITNQVRCKTQLSIALMKQDIPAFEEAESVLLEALSLSRVYRGPHSPDTLLIMCILGENFVTQDRPDQAESLFREVLQTSQQGIVLGVQLRATNSLGELLLKQENYVEAEYLLLETLEAEDTLLQEAGLDRSEAKWYLMRTFQGQGLSAYHSGSYGQAELKYKEATRLARECDEQDESTVGELALWSAHCYFKQSKFKEAEEAFREALEKHSASLHAVVLAYTRVYLGEALAYQVKWVEAELVFRAVLDTLADLTEDNYNLEVVRNDDEDDSEEPDSRALKVMLLALYWLARARHAQCDYTEATLLWTKVLEFEADDLECIDDDRAQIKQWLRDAIDRGRGRSPQSSRFSISRIFRKSKR